MATRITNVRSAGAEHQVVTVTGSARSTYQRQPCAKCPWRIDATGEFPAEAFRHSANTAEDMSDHTFACHTTGTAKPAVCAGFLLRNSANNLGVRLMIHRGDLDPSAVSDGGLDLHDSYKTMAVANGLDPADPALARCRADNE